MDNIFSDTILCDEIKLAGLKVKLTKSQLMNFEIISKHWKMFNSFLHKIKGRSSSNNNWVKYGVTYKEDDNHYYLAAIPYDLSHSYPSKIEKITIPYGDYAQFNHKGEIQNIKISIAYIFRDFFPSNNNNLTFDDNSKIVFIEKYDNKFHWYRSDSIIEILVPVVK